MLFITRNQIVNMEDDLPVLEYSIFDTETKTQTKINKTNPQITEICTIFEIIPIAHMMAISEGYTNYTLVPLEQFKGTAKLVKTYEPK